MRKLRNILFLFCGIAALSWSSGGSDGKSSPEASVPQEIRVASAFFTGDQEGDLAAMDPARRGTWGFYALMWAPLVAGDTEGNYLPDKSLATKWDVSPDGKVYTFHLRDAKFSDGTPITAQNVVDCFGHYGMMLHSAASGYRQNFSIARRLISDIEGMLDFPKNYPYDEFSIGGPISGISAPDSKTVQIKLTGPSVTFIKRLMVTFSVFKVDDLLKGKTAKYDIKDYWTGKAVASGPYKLMETVPGAKIVMVPNEHYFGPKPALTKITSLAVSRDMNTILTAYQNNELDAVAASLTGDAARQAMGDPRLSSDLVKMPMWQVSQFWITPNIPLDDVNVRRAFSMAFDRATMVKILNAGSLKPLYETVNMHRNPAVPDAKAETAAVKMLPFDPQAAKEELKKSKYWPQVLDMEINLYAPSAAEVPMMETMQKMLTENLGMKKVIIHNQRISDLMNPPFPIHLWYNTQMPWFADVIDTLKNMAWQVPDKPWQEGMHRPYTAVPYEPELRKLTDQAFAENDPAKRAKLVGQIGQLWNDTAFSLDFAVPVAYYLMKPKLTGFEWYQNGGQGLPLNIEKARVK